MSRRPIEARIDPHGEDEGGPGIPVTTFKSAFAEWASAVTIVAVRDDGRVHGVTVSSFAPVSAEPPQVVVSLGPSASVVPFLKEGTRFVVSLLAAEQRRLASAFADPYPVGPSPFPPEGDPVVEGALLSVVCSVRSVHEVESRSRLVVGLVEEVVDGTGEGPLLYHRRGYRRVAED